MAIKQTLRRGNPKKGTELSEDLLCNTIEFDVRDPNTGCIDHTITPHKRQIGLDHPNYQADLVVKGVTLPEGGLQLPNDGYMNFGKLQGDLGIGLRAADDPQNPGTTTIQVRDEGGTWGNISGGGGGSISQINDATNGGIGVTNGAGPIVTLSIDANDLIALGATVDTSDSVIIYDTDAALSKKALVSNLPFTNNIGTVTPSSTDTFTNKSGAISQWTNDSGFTNNTGTVTSVTISGADGVDIDSGSPITTSGTIALGLSNIPNASLANDHVEIAGKTVTLGAANTDIAYSDLSTGAPTATNTAKGIVEYATNAEVGLAQSSTVVIRPSSIGSINTSDLNNDAGFTNNTGTVTPSSTNTFTNKTLDAAGTGNSITNIPNASLDNSDISGISLGSNLASLTIGNGIALNSGTTYNGSGAKSLSVDLDGSTISSGAGGIAVVSTPGTLTAALGGGLTLSSPGFDGSGDVAGSVNFGVSAGDGTYTNASVTVLGNQVTNVTSGGAAGGIEVAFIRGYTVGDDDYFFQPVANTDRELKFTTMMNTGPPNFTPVAEGCVIEVNQGNNIALVNTQQSGVIEITNAGTYMVTATIDCTHDNLKAAQGNSTFSASLKRTDQGSSAEFATTGNSIMPHGFNSMFQVSGIAIFTGGTMSLHVSTTNENSLNDKLTTGTLANGQFAVTVSIEKIA